MNSNIRIKELRQALGLSQEEFGKKIACSRDVINNYERQRANVPPPTELAIASAFNVNLEWLHDGTLPMFLETKEQSIDKLAKKYGLDDFMRKVIMAFAELNDSEKDAVKKFIMMFMPPDDPEQREWLKIKSSSEPNLKLNELENVPSYARSQDDTTPAGKQIPKSEIKAALAERAKDDDDL